MVPSGPVRKTRPMRWRPLFAAASVGLWATTLLAGDASTVVSFAALKPGMAPEGFRWPISSRDEPGSWRIDRVAGSTALVQSHVGQRGYRVAVRDVSPLADVYVGARLRVGSGDRAAGIAWRIQDVGTYYAARLDLDRHEMVLYKFVGGNRVRRDRRTPFRVATEGWHELVLEHRRPRIDVWLNGVPVLHEEDDSVRAPGRVGLWMPGDGTAAFERLWYRALQDPAPLQFDDTARRPGASGPRGRRRGTTPERRLRPPRSGSAP